MPSYGYRAQDMMDDGIDDDIANNIGEIANLVNNPSAEGLLAAICRCAVAGKKKAVA